LFTSGKQPKRHFQISTGLEPGVTWMKERRQARLHRENYSKKRVLRHPICTLEFDDPEFQQISHLYVTESEEPIHNDEQEWQWSGWMSKAEVDDLLRENKLCTDTAALYERYVSEFENLSEGL
jgi:hypothetical protein